MVVSRVSEASFHLCSCARAFIDYPAATEGYLTDQCINFPVN